MPGRDDKWKAETVANTSELQFEQEFGNTFHGRGNTLISANHLLAQASVEPEFFKDNVWIYKQPVREHEYVMTVDVSKGRAQDYSTFTIIDVTTKPLIMDADTGGKIEHFNLNIKSMERLGISAVISSGPSFVSLAVQVSSII